jgi:DNA-binding MarR family transcriptional regulator
MPQTPAPASIRGIDIGASARIFGCVCNDVNKDLLMAGDARPRLEDCNCLAVRQAARHVTQFYDQYLAEVGLRTTQFSILAKLRYMGPVTINALAADMVMDRTTLGRNILPLERGGLVRIVQGRADRRSKELHLTEAGAARLRAGIKRWAEAQTRFEATFGAKRALALRTLLRAVSASHLDASARATLA